MNRDSRAGLYPESESVHKAQHAPTAKRSAISDQQNASIVQGNERLPILSKDLSPIGIPLNLPPIVLPAPVTLQSDDYDFEALIKEILERQRSASPEPPSGKGILHPWPSWKTVEQADDAKGYGQSTARDSSLPLQPPITWHIPGPQDDSKPSMSAQKLEPHNGDLGASFQASTSINSHPQCMYSKPGVLEEVALSEYQLLSAQWSARTLTNLYDVIDPDPPTTMRSEATALPASQHIHVNHSSTGSAKREISGVGGSPRKPGLSKSMTRKDGLDTPHGIEPALGLEDLFTSSSNESHRKEGKMVSQSNYKEDEKKLVLYYLRKEVSRGNLTESKWEKISRKLVKHGLRRSKCSIKAWWSRYGREETGFDERQNPNGRNMVTSKQNPEDRRNARRLKKQQLRKSDRSCSVEDQQD
ncbi:MAG: hypothetical protein Q9209_007233 [Squamulea sp. 1 TL-2023]